MSRTELAPTALLALSLPLAAACQPDHHAVRVGAHQDAHQDEPAPAPREKGLSPSARPDTHDELIRAREAPRHSSDGGGRAWMVLEEGEEALARAGQPGRWTIRYEAGPEGIQVGGFVRLTVPRYWDWSPAQDFYEQGYGYTIATTEAEGLLLRPRTQPEFWIDFFVRGRALEAGETITIVYGAGPEGALADRYAERESAFWITVDGDGDGIGEVLADSPTVRVLPGPAEILRATLPSTAEPGDTVTLRLALLDRAGSRGVEFEGEVQLAVVPDGLELPESVTLDAEAGGVLRLDAVVHEPGVYRVLARAVAGNRELVTASNPLLVEKDVAPIRWGDFHGHSNLSDGTGTPEDFLRYAREVAGLDAVCLTDHDHWGMLFLDDHPELWQRIRDATNAAYAPGEFVPMVGFEWTSWLHGHRHVMYFGEEGEILSSIDPETQNPGQLWDALRGKPALTFAHHSAGGPVATNWNYPPDPELEPVTEVVSVHGNSEAPEAPYPIYSPVRGNYVRDVLDRGYVLGFIGSGDSHDGHPGLAQLASPFGAGMAALLTDDLTREGVRAALQERRCYATNGPRILLRAAIDAHPMGSVIEPGDEGTTHLLYVRAVGTEHLRSIEVIRSGEVIAAVPGDEHYDLAATFDLEPLRPGEFVYVRAVQADDGAAWSSPFYVR